jgi:hypothetical protein
MANQNKEVTQMTTYKTHKSHKVTHLTQYAQRCTKKDPLRFTGHLHTVDTESSGNKTLCGLTIGGTGRWYIYHQLEIPTPDEVTPCPKCKAKV